MKSVGDSLPPKFHKEFVLVTRKYCLRIADLPKNSKSLTPQECQDLRDKIMMVKVGGGNLTLQKDITGEITTIETSLSNINIPGLSLPSLCKYDMTEKETPWHVTSFPLPIISLNTLMDEYRKAYRKNLPKEFAAHIFLILLECLRQFEDQLLCHNQLFDHFVHIQVSPCRDKTEFPEISLGGFEKARCIRDGAADQLKYQDPEIKSFLTLFASLATGGKYDEMFQLWMPAEPKDVKVQKGVDAEWNKLLLWVWPLVHPLNVYRGYHRPHFIQQEFAEVAQKIQDSATPTLVRKFNDEVDKIYARTKHTTVKDETLREVKLKPV